MWSSGLNLFSPEVLDTRLGPAADPKVRQQIQSSAGPRRWNTLEFYIYGIFFAFCVPMMFKAAMNASSTASPNFDLYKDQLSPGWMFGRLVDNSDAQYSSFRNNLPYLALVLVIHKLLRYTVFDVLKTSKNQRINFDVIFSTVFLFALHGINFFKILAILCINFYIAKLPDKQTSYILSWVFGVGILFANELTNGYEFKRLGDQLAWLDAYAGIIARWDVHFNFTMLRMISFNVDELHARSDADLKGQQKQATLTERERINTSHALSEYSFKTYFAYTTYSPLYIAGPVITFNDFLSQTYSPLVSVSFERITKYLIRFLVCLFTMEFVLHFTYVVAISQTRAWQGDTPFQISMVALFNLNVIWLKLLLPWRFFRLWGLIDEIDAPENMIRCVDNNYSASSFWRSWHRSYNRWVTRYIYIPLGGSKRPIINSLIVFTFVAFWHDIQLRLLVWGWLVVFFILPEVIAGVLIPAKKYGSCAWYRHLCAVGGVANVWMMMIANLIGFCVGPDGMKVMLDDMLSTAAGLKYVILSTVCLFVGVQAMFEFRESEKRRGINLRC